MALELNGTTGVQGNSGAFVQGTSVASTSGTSIDFTSIPSWVKRVTVVFNGVSTNGTSNYLVQIGTSSGVTTTGYTSMGGRQAGSATSESTSTAGYVINSANGATVAAGQLTIMLVSGNTWVSSHQFGTTGVNSTLNGGGSVALAATLDRVRITTVNGTDTFDAGSINILYE